jgi:hypothetical protein
MMRKRSGKLTSTHTIILQACEKGSETVPRDKETQHCMVYDSVVLDIENTKENQTHCPDHGATYSTACQHFLNTISILSKTTSVTEPAIGNQRCIKNKGSHNTANDKVWFDFWGSGDVGYVGHALRVAEHRGIGRNSKNRRILGISWRKFGPVYQQRSEQDEPDESGACGKHLGMIRLWKWCPMSSGGKPSKKISVTL